MIRRFLIVLSAVLMMVAAVLPAVGAQEDPPEDPAVMGSFTAPFVEPTIDGVESAEKCLPEDENGHEECKPAAGTVVMLPNGRFLYHNALENTEDVDVSIVAEFGSAAINDQSRVMDLSNEDQPTWLSPDNVRGGANPDGNDSEPIPPLPSDIDENPYNDGALFCSDVTLLPDGRVMAVGGTDYYTEPGLGGEQGENNDDDNAQLPLVGDPTEFGPVELQGLEESRIFDPETDAWTQTGTMEFGRWYPTLVTMGDGNVFVASGVTKLLKPVYVTHPLDSGANVRQTETFGLDNEEWSRNGPADDVGSGDRSLPLYPRLHMLPDGDVYYNTAGQVFNPAGQSIDEPLWNIAATYDPESQTWTDLGIPGSPAALDLEGAGLGGLTSSLNLGDPESSAANLADLIAELDPASLPEGIDQDELVETLNAGTLEELLNPDSLDPVRLAEIAAAIAGGDLGALGGQLDALPDDLTQALGAGFRGSTSSVMLPLQPDADGNYTDAEFLTAGGILGPSPGTYAAIPFSRIDSVDVSGDSQSLTSRTTGSLNRARWYGNGVGLPDRSVMTFSGASADEVVAPGTGVPILQAERFNPVTEEWELAATQANPRTYHNTGIIMADGRVLVGGHAPISTAYLNNTPIPGPFSPSDRDPSFEIYSPPYVFHDNRPTITSVPTQIDHGETFTIETPDAADIEVVSLVRQPSLTHLVDGDQRTVELPIVSRGDGEITVMAPPNGDVAPLGQYIVFVSTLDGEDLIPGEGAPTGVEVPLAGELDEEPEDDGTGDPADGRVETDRTGGDDRIETSVLVSQANFDQADTVLVARSDDYADALTGTPLAHQEAAPLLLTDRESLSESTATEIDRLGATNVIVLGGEDAVTTAVFDALGTDGRDVRRIAGTNRFGTGQQVASELPDGSIAYLAEGEHADPMRGWPDALAAAPIAAVQSAPILLVNAERLPDETAQVLADRGVTETVVAGGTSAVSDDVVQQISAYGPRRLAGIDRFGTAVELGRDAMLNGLFTTNDMFVATGADWPDSLSAGPAVAAAGSTLLLVDGQSLSNSTATAERLTELKGSVDQLHIIGGTNAISVDVVDEIRTALSE